MTQNSSPRVKFFVYVVESPSAQDFYHGRSEGEMLKQILQLHGIPCVTRCAVSKEAFVAALSIGVHEVMQQFPDFLPILHISAHGHSEGIELSVNDLIKWQELKDILKPINQALSNCLVVCMSSCRGYAGSRMAMWTYEQELPFFAIVGNSEDPTWADTATGYTCFYHQLAKGSFVTEAVEAMRVASGNQTFFSTTAENARAGYIEYLNQIDTVTARQRIEDAPNSMGLTKFGTWGPQNAAGGSAIRAEQGMKLSALSTIGLSDKKSKQQEIQ